MADALVGGAFLSATLQVIFDRLASPEVVNFFRGPKRNEGDKLLQKLKLSLRGMKPVLDDAETRQITDQSVQEWVDELKHVVYEADDLVDEIATEALRLKGNHKVASQKWSHRWPSTSLVDESCVFGRDSDKEEIMNLLVSNEQSGSKIDVIPIVGMGGVGKTTLAQLVYNDVRVVQHFEMKAWVCVSEKFDVIRVTKTILEEVTSRNDDTQNLNQLQIKLKESLRGKKFLIVLDDVWNESLGNWDILKAPFTVGACGSKIIATTRNLGVASIMQTVLVIICDSGSGINELEEFDHLRRKLSLSASYKLEVPHNENYGGTRFPDWLGDQSYSKIVSLFLNECHNLFSLPPLGQLASLKCLYIARMNGITRVGQEFYGDVSSTKPFQSLETLHFEEMSEWVDWQLFGNGEFSQLRELWLSSVRSWLEVTRLPENIPSLVRLEIRECSGLMASLPRSCAAGQIVLAGCDGVGLGWQAEMERCYTSLESLELIKCDTITHLPLDFFPKLHFLNIWSCDNLEALSIPNGRGLQILTSLESVSIMWCRSMVSFPQGGLPAPNLRRFGLESCLKLKGGLPSNLLELRIYNCKKLVDRRREWGLQRLPSLRDFELRGDEDVGDSFPEEGLLPSTLTILTIANLSNLKSLNKRGFQFLCSLKSLIIFRCAQLRSLPEEVPASLETMRILDCPQLQAFPEKGLPPSHSRLIIRDCPLLKPRCQRDRGDDWHKIAHIPFIEIDDEMIS
ncbi:NB-ARC domain-containing disease resistance protein [Actinidia rufa]|uniref:NB-ARC domain-containing disease resistance protein n=1 Tax=Actinidia rufa TaxID=165716 RepID=A0A7J0ERW1_9ERIC|nr:NB-ARC domain-containing disease resistance protein [Actinidia rufa]